VKVAGQLLGGEQILKATENQGGKSTEKRSKKRSRQQEPSIETVSVHKKTRKSPPEAKETK